MQQIGVYGSAFNPPTFGHRDVLAQASSFDEILLVPSISHAFGKALISFEHRLAMLALFCEDLPFNNKPKVTISLVEKEIFERNRATGPVYTFDVLSELSKQFPLKKLHFILGPDNAKPETWKKFYRYQEIEQQWPLFIAKENVAIHSTMAREICFTYAKQDDIRIEKLINIVGEKIAYYIEDNQLYRERESSYG
ncbi:MAG: hypothetical protein AB7V32_07680 [Candidatus Berkiella sp.]